MNFRFLSRLLSILLKDKAAVIKVATAAVNMRLIQKRKMNLSHLMRKKINIINKINFLFKTKHNILIQIIVLYSEY